MIWGNMVYCGILLYIMVYYDRDESKIAELVLVPYNYLLDNNIRNTLEIDWKDAVIIFDEAHNLERVAADAASFTLTSTDIATCIEELQHGIRILQQGDATIGVASSDKNKGNCILLCIFIYYIMYIHIYLFIIYILYLY